MREPTPSRHGWHVKFRSSPTHLKLDDLGNEARGTVESYGRPIDGSDIKKDTHVFKQCVQFLMIFRFHFVIPNDLLVLNSNWWFHKWSVWKETYRRAWTCSRGHHAWLVIWNIFVMTFHILGRKIPTDEHNFQRGRYTTNQIITIINHRITIIINHILTVYYPQW